MMASAARRSFAFALLALLMAGACGTTPAGHGGSPSPSPAPTGPPLSLAELRIRVLHALPGTVDWCDPDYYPIAVGNEVQRARQALPAMRKDTATYDAVLDDLGIPADAQLTNAQLVRVYDEYKLVAHDTPITLTTDGDVDRFELAVLPTNGGYDDKIVGHVTPDGSVTIDQRIQGDGGAHSFKPNCPICLARDTRIAVPGGFVRVQDVRVGMAVWSTDRSENRIRAVVVRTGHVAVPPTHLVVRLVLANGRRVLVSPEHPTPDGRAVGSLRTGMAFDGSKVVSARWIPYAGGFTYDLLPSGPTGTYFANGVLLGSTLAQAPMTGASTAGAFEAARAGPRIAA